ncbi:MAG: ABC transporter ATP-binding protein [Bacteroidales bacterium]
MNEIIADLKQASKQYKSGDSVFTALYPTDLTLYRGELLLLMGPSGSGKTTLLSLIGSVIYPTSGEVYIGGKLTSGLNEVQLARLRLNTIGFVFQNYNLIAPLTAINNVAFPLQLQKIAARETGERALNSLRTVKMEHRKDALPKQMSGGEQQRVAIARALVTNPDIILCDEPTGALDQKSGEMVMLELRDLARAGKCVVVVTHDPRLVSFADRIIYLEDGHVSDRPFDQTRFGTDTFS